MPASHSEEEWDLHQAAIRRLYLTENRKLQGSNGVIQEMSRSYGFNATKAQYERRFKKWGFRKNKNKDIWETIAHKVAKRKRATEVQIDGEIVPAKKLRKELSRYGYKAAIPHALRGSSPTTPEEVRLSIYTPPGSVPSTPRNVTFVEFNTPGPRLLFEWSPSLPWLRFERRFSEEMTILTSGSYLTSSVERATIPIKQILQGLFQQNSAKTTKDDSPDVWQRMLSCIMPELHNGQNLSRVTSILNLDRATCLNALMIQLYTLSNNLIHEIDSIEKSVTFARLFLSTLAGRRKKSSSADTQPTMLALLQKCFQTCQSSPDILKICLKMGISPDLTVWSEKYHAFLKPIQIATFDENLEAVRLLIRAGADVNKTGSVDQPTSLGIAFALQYTRVSRLLLDSGANPQKRFRGKTILAFKQALDNFYPREMLVGEPSALSILVTNLWRPLAGSECSHIEFLQEVLDKSAVFEGSDVLQKDTLNHLLYVAVASQTRIRVEHTNFEETYFEDIVDTLVRNGGVVDAESTWGISPLSLAVLPQVDERVYTILLSLGARPDRQSCEYRHSRPTALHTAALYGNTKAVQALLNAGANVNQPVTLAGEDTEVICAALGLDILSGAKATGLLSRLLTQCHTPLHFALNISPLFVSLSRKLFDQRRESKIETAQLLLSHGAHLSGGELVRAIDLGNLELVQRLHCEHSLCLTERFDGGRTPLQTAIRQGFHDIVRYLVHHGAKPGNTDICNAIATRQPPELIQYLESNSITSNQQSFTESNQDSEDQAHRLIEAFSTGQIKVMTQMMNRLPLTYESTALCAAIMGIRNRGYPLDENPRALLVPVINEFLKRYSSATAGEIDNTAIAMSAYFGYKEIMNLLLNKFTGLRSQECLFPFGSFRNLLSASGNKSIGKMVEQMDFHWLHNLYTSTTVTVSPLVAAIMGGDEKILLQLLDHGFRTDEASMLIAIISDRQDHLKILLARGTDPNIRYSRFDSPLQFAVRLDRQKIVQMLLDSGADINTDPASAPWGASYLPRTALQLAVEAGNIDLAHKFVEMGAAINAPPAPHSGASALQLAAAKGYIGLARYLVEHGADINAEAAEVRGRTALELAAEYGRLDMVDFFLNHCPCALTEGDHAHQYIRAVRFAEKNGHIAVEKVLENFRPWTAPDNELYKKYGTLIDEEGEEASDQGDEQSTDYEDFSELEGDECSNAEDEDFLNPEKGAVNHRGMEHIVPGIWGNGVLESSVHVEESGQIPFEDFGGLFDSSSSSEFQFLDNETGAANDDDSNNVDESWLDTLLPYSVHALGNSDFCGVNDDEWWVSGFSLQSEP